MSACALVGMVETVRGARNLVTPHPPDAYADRLVVKPGPGWKLFIIVPEDGQTLLARGGEEAYGYVTVDGGRAQGFTLRPGDRATIVRSSLPHAFVEWRIERAEA
jgi:hypothetical protein